MNVVVESHRATVSSSRLKFLRSAGETRNGTGMRTAVTAPKLSDFLPIPSLGIAYFGPPPCPLSAGTCGVHWSVGDLDEQLQPIIDNAGLLLTHLASKISEACSCLTQSTSLSVCNGALRSPVLLLQCMLTLTTMGNEAHSASPSALPAFDRFGSFLRCLGVSIGSSIIVVLLHECLKSKSSNPCSNENLVSVSVVKLGCHVEVQVWLIRRMADGSVSSTFY